MDESDKYAEFVDHPRFGRRPHVTGLNPSPQDRDVQLHWNTVELFEVVAQYESATGRKWPHGNVPFSIRGRRIPDTAIVADLTHQTPATVAVTHYFDLERKCRDCARSFIFLAVEQKHWYEVLGFGLDSDCVRCAKCRKRQQEIGRKREIYETLFHVADKTEEQCIQMADACLSLIEAGVFTKRQTERVRMLLNLVLETAGVHEQFPRSEFVERIRLAEKKSEK